MNIQVILLLYSRPDHTLSALKGIAANGIEKVTAYLDYSDNEEIKIKQDEIRSIVKGFQGCEIDLIERVQKLGLAGSVRASLNSAFSEGYDAAILLEDDCVLRAGGYDFFRQGLIHLKDNKKVRSLCGYLFPECNFVFDLEGDLLLLNRFSTWGWATWADRWKQYDSNLGKVVESMTSLGLNIDDFASDIAVLCTSDKYLKNEVDIWSINWILLHFLSSTFSVYPRESVIENIGLDGSGANCLPTDVFTSMESNKIRNTYNWDMLPYFIENEMMVKDFMAKNGLKTYPNP